MDLIQLRTRIDEHATSVGSSNRARWWISLLGALGVVLIAALSLYAIDRQQVQVLPRETALASTLASLTNQIKQLQATMQKQSQSLQALQDNVLSQAERPLKQFLGATQLYSTVDSNNRQFMLYTLAFADQSFSVAVPCWNVTGSWHSDSYQLVYDWNTKSATAYFSDRGAITWQL